MHATQLERDKRYNETPRGRFKQAKARAKSRGVPWLLTFDEWWGIWQKSGKWERRGNSRGHYCMCRIGDEGPYAKGNVYIELWEVNTADRNHTEHGYPERRSDKSRVVRRHTARSTHVSFAND